MASVSRGFSRLSLPALVSPPLFLVDVPDRRQLEPLWSYTLVLSHLLRVSSDCKHFKHFLSEVLFHSWVKMLLLLLFHLYYVSFQFVVRPTHHFVAPMCY